MGGGGGGYFPSNPDRLQRLIEEARGTEAQQRLDSNVNELLQDALATFNSRNAERVREYLAKVKETIGDEIEMEQFLFGGSVAKHTYVDGLSDVDALVILNRDDLAKKPPREVLKTFHESLSDRLTYDEISSIEKGRMAVTITYRNGTQIQLLPAVRVRGKVAIPSATANEWNETNPKAFQKELTKANERLNGTLVPSIKLVKSIIGGLPEQKRLTGYHIESLCLESVSGYRGVKTVKGVVLHALEEASFRVLRPLGDVTGQSRVVDSYLGKANSVERRIVADAIAGIGRRLKAATTVEEWKKVLDA